MAEPLEVGETVPMPKETRAERSARVKSEMRAEERALIDKSNAEIEGELALLARKESGRPSTYTEAKALEICTRIALGQSLKAITKLDGFPSEPTVMKWLSDNPPFVKLYSRARELQGDALVDEALDIADSMERDIVTLEDDEGKKRQVLNPVAVARDRVRIDARFRLAGKLNPKKWGDKVIQELSGPDGGPIETTIIPGDALTRDARQRLREILATARDITPDK